MIPDITLLKLLREIAEEDAAKGEYHKEEHTCWLAADRIETLQAMINGVADPQLLHEIATRLWYREQSEITSQQTTKLDNSNMQPTGTG